MPLTWDQYNKSITGPSPAIANKAKPVTTWEGLNAQNEGYSATQGQHAKVAGMQADATTAQAEANKAAGTADIANKIAGVATAPFAALKNIGRGLIDKTDQPTPEVIPASYFQELGKTARDTVGGYAKMVGGQLASGKTLETIGQIAGAPFAALNIAEKGVGALTTSAAQAITGKKITPVENYKQAPTVQQLIASSAENQNSTKPIDYFFPEFFSSLLDTGASTVALGVFGSELATKSGSIKITPEQLSGTEPIPEAHANLVNNMFKGAPEEVLNAVRENGVEIKAQAPAGGIKQAVGEFIGGQAPEKGVTVKIPGYEGTKALPGGVSPETPGPAEIALPKAPGEAIAPRETMTPPTQPTTAPVLFHGSQGKVTTTPNTFTNVKIFPTDQHDVIADLAKQGDQRAQAIVQNPIDFYVRSDALLRDLYGGQYDAIRYDNQQLPQKGIEYHDLKDGKFYSENPDTAMAYSLQNRGGKYEVKPSPQTIAEQMAKQFEPYNKIVDTLVISHNVPQKIANEIARQAITAKEPNQPIAKPQKQPLSREQELKQAIDTKVEQARREMGLVAQREGAGVRLRPVTDATGGFQFMAKDFKLSRAKGRMASQAKNFKNEARDLLLQNDSQFKQMVDEYNKIIAAKPTEAMAMPTFRVRGGGLASKEGAKMSINDMLSRIGKKESPTSGILSSIGGKEKAKPFIISEEAKKILDDLGIPSREKDLSHGLLGIYKPMSENIRVQALSHITTVVHEATHAIDHKFHIFDQIKANTGPGATLRKELSQVYADLYPGAKPTHSLEKRLKEGFATFIEHYFYNPADISTKYPLLVDKFIHPGGEYNNADITKLLDAMNALVDKYAQLTPEERIGARIRRGKEVVEQDRGFSLTQAAVYNLFDRFEPFRRAAKLAGVQHTWDDPTVQGYNTLNKSTIIANWMKGDGTPILKRDGNWEVRPGVVADYMKLVMGSEKEFDSFLVARRVVSDHNRYVALQQQIADENIMEKIKSADEANKKITIAPELMKIVGKKDFLEYEREIVAEATQLKTILNNDDFHLQDALAVIDQYSTKFAEASKIYDGINSKLIDYMQNTGLIDTAKADKLKSNDGYASFRRYIDDELNVGGGKVGPATKGKVSALKQRSGSTLDILSPVYNQLMAISEVVGKGLDNMMWDRVANLAKKHPAIAQRFEPMPSQPAVDGQGNISFPQEHDPNVIRVWQNGKRTFYKAAPEFLAVAKVFQSSGQDKLAQALAIPTQIFTRLTTTAYPLFAVGNFTVDQFSAFMQTKTGYKPVIDPMKSLVEFIKNTDTKNLYVNIGGKRQTLASFYRTSPEEIPQKFFHQLGKNERGRPSKIAHAAVKAVDGAIDLLEMPSNISEMATRFGEFKNALEQGKSHSVAMYLASEVSVPFQLSGAFWGQTGRSLMRSIPYFNAALQVAYKFGRTGAENPKKVATLGAGILTAGLALAIGIMKAASDEQKRQFSNLDGRLLSRYLYMPLPDGKTLMRMRIPEQFGALVGVINLFVISHYGGNRAKFNEYLDAITTALPNQLDITNPKQMIFSYIPQALKPSIEVAANTKTYPRVMPILPDFMKYEPPSERYTAYTSRVAKWLGQLFNASPALIDFWIKEQFGALSNVMLGNIPTNPIYQQEDRFALAGRANNRFYDQKSIVDYQYKQVTSGGKGLSDQEKLDITWRHKAYTEMANTLSDWMKVAKQQNFKDLPDTIKSDVYNALLDFQKDKTPLELLDRANKIKVDVYAYKQAHHLD